MLGGLGSKSIATEDGLIPKSVAGMGTGVIHKFADGTMLISGNGFTSTPPSMVYFPEAFISDVSIVCSAYGQVSLNNYLTRAAIISRTGFTPLATDASHDGNYVAGVYQYIAIGRWK